MKNHIRSAAGLLSRYLVVFAALTLVAGCSAGGPDEGTVVAPTTTETDSAEQTKDQEATPVIPADDTADDATGEETTGEDTTGEAGQETATFGAGCFWCVEAVLEQLDGVAAVRSGYMGGHVENPTYEAVCRGETGHAEIVQVDFDPAQISYETLLEWFFRLHDPTTLNRQGADVGTQYRSVIFFHSDAQRASAEKVKAAFEASGTFSDPIVTEISAAAPFYEAEDYHQDYYRNNTSAGYCRVVIRPKLDKLGLDTLDGK